MSRLTLVLAKGRLLAPSLEALGRAGIAVPVPDPGDRQAVIDVEGLRLVVVRDDDVPTYVAYGVADLGIVGKDVLDESAADVVELADLGYAPCRLVLAVPGEQTGPVLPPGLAVATKYPRTAAAYFARQHLPARIVHVHGAAELAPRLGLADGVVDLVATGRTLEANGLRVVDTILHSSARLVANCAANHLRGGELWQLADRLRAAARGGERG